jgi:hypothetical protein
VFPPKHNPNEGTENCYANEERSRLRKSDQTHRQKTNRNDGSSYSAIHKQTTCYAGMFTGHHRITVVFHINDAKYWTQLRYVPTLGRGYVEKEISRLVVDNESKCPVSGKRQYASEAEALATAVHQIAATNAPKELHAYLCSWCGAWHLTKKTGKSGKGRR